MLKKPNLVNNFVSVFFILFFLFPILKQKDPSYNKRGKPSTWGIIQYIEKNQDLIIKEYEYQIDSLYDVYIFTENLYESDENDLGIFYLPDYIVITNQEKFIAYEFKDLSKFKQKTMNYTERTVKGVIFHELTHAYFNQILVLMQNYNINVSPEYKTLRMFPNPNYRFGTEFIEEGICEYCVYYLKESVPLTNVVIPQNKNDLTDEMNKINNIYCYSVIFLKDFLDEYGIKKGIEILLSNKPPSYEEILYPKIFFDRLNVTTSLKF